MFHDNKTGRYISKHKAISKINKNFGKDESYNNNCQMCAIAYEALYKGKEITVKGYNPKNGLMKQLSINPAIAFKYKNSNKNPSFERIKIEKNNKIYDFINNKIKNNERYILGANIKLHPDLKSTGHALNIEKNNNELLIINTQTANMSATQDEIKKYFNLIDTTFDIKLLRTDNLEIKEEFLDLIEEK